MMLVKGSASQSVRGVVWLPVKVQNGHHRPATTALPQERMIAMAVNTS